MAPPPANNQHSTRAERALWVLVPEDADRNLFVISCWMVKCGVRCGGDMALFFGPITHRQASQAIKPRQAEKSTSRGEMMMNRTSRPPGQQTVRLQSHNLMVAKWFIVLISLGLIGLWIYMYRRQANAQVKVVPERFITDFDRRDNVDSLVIWHSGNRDWIIATAKASNSLLVYNIQRNGASVGKPRIPGAKRPNGLALLPDRNDLLLSVERDGRRITVLSLPDFNVLHTFAQNDLKRPYGLDIVAQVTGQKYVVYVTDNYMDLSYSKKHTEMRPRKIPDRQKLSERILMYELTISKEGQFDTTLLKKFGDTSGDGILNIVETVQADPELNRLLIADEHEKVIKVYDLDGQFTGPILGRGIFQGEPEGFALLQCGNSGYWFLTDQLTPYTHWHLFERRTLHHVGSFKGLTTSNTDGVALSKVADLFCAAHGDSSIACFSISSVLSNLGLECA